VADEQDDELTDHRVLAMGVLMERYGLTRTKAALLLTKIATRSSVPIEALASRVVNSVGLHRDNRRLSSEP
jgi:AmiR/NasT family two-component response regulator